jgi:hypothetical protein
MNDNDYLLMDNRATSLPAPSRTGLERLDRIVYLLDDLIRVPIINRRIGLDPLIGLIPWAGDAVAALLGLYILGSAVYYRIPKVIILRMGANVIIDALFGMIPWIGDASDFFIKSNRWNLNLLREHADAARQPKLSDYLFVGLVLAVVAAVIIACIALAGAILFAGYNLIRSTGWF